MRIACVGAGPAGLYFAVLMKLADPAHEVVVYEREAEGLVRGWGVTFWDNLMEEMATGDPVSAAEIAERSAHWTGVEVHLHGRGETVQPTYSGHSIERAELIAVLTGRARELGVELAYGRTVSADDLAAEADLVIAADGVNSEFRRGHAAELGSTVTLGRNRFVWLATPHLFSAFRFAFRELGDSWICCYAYAFSESASTFVVECPPETYEAQGFATMSAAETLTALEGIFDWQLDGQPLTVKARSDGSAGWARFPTVRNRRWHVGRVALMGDSAHTTHYSIGFGTKLALEDGLVLARAIAAEPDLDAALRSYTATRLRELERPQRNATHSARWFERAGRYLRYDVDNLTALLNRRREPLMAYVPPAVFVGLRRLLLRRRVS